MSLETSITTRSLDKPTARQIGKTVTQASGLAVCPRISLFKQTCTRFDLPNVHDMLTEKADWDAATWDLDVQQLPRLALAVDQLARHLNYFTFRMAWVSESTLKKIPIEIAELLTLIHESKIGNRVEYEVTATRLGF